MADDRDRARRARPFLVAVTLHHRKWTPQPTQAWPNHCEFCHAEFGTAESQGALQIGWTTGDAFFWICDQCFTDNRDWFEWKVGTQ